MWLCYQNQWNSGSLYYRPVRPWLTFVFGLNKHTPTLIDRWKERKVLGLCMLVTFHTDFLKRRWEPTSRSLERWNGWSFQGARRWQYLEFWLDVSILYHMREIGDTASWVNRERSQKLFVGTCFCSITNWNLFRQEDRKDTLLSSSSRKLWPRLLQIPWTTTWCFTDCSNVRINNS